MRIILVVNDEGEGDDDGDEDDAHDDRDAGDSDDDEADQGRQQNFCAFSLCVFFACAVIASRRRARRWSSPPAPRRARAPAASTPHTHDAASFRNFAAPARTDDRRTMRRAVRRSG